MSNVGQDSHIDIPVIPKWFDSFLGSIGYGNRSKTLVMYLLLQAKYSPKPTETQKALRDSLEAHNVTDSEFEDLMLAVSSGKWDVKEEQDQDILYLVKLLTKDFVGKDRPISSLVDYLTTQSIIKGNLVEEAEWVMENTKDFVLLWDLYGEEREVEGNYSRGVVTKETKKN